MVRIQTFMALNPMLYGSLSCCKVRWGGKPPFLGQSHRCLSGNGGYPQMPIVYPGKLLFIYMWIWFFPWVFPLVLFIFQVPKPARSAGRPAFPLGAPARFRPRQACTFKTPMGSRVQAAKLSRRSSLVISRHLKLGNTKVEDNQSLAEREVVAK